MVVSPQDYPNNTQCIMWMICIVSNISLPRASMWTLADFTSWSWSSPMGEATLTKHCTVPMSCHGSSDIIISEFSRLIKAIAARFWDLEFDKEEEKELDWIGLPRKNHSKRRSLWSLASNRLPVWHEREMVWLVAAAETSVPIPIW